jgi:hypothetical protein
MEGEHMREGGQTLTAIEYAFVVAVMASFCVLVAGGFFFGFYVNEWTERQGIFVGIIATIAGIIGASFGVRMASGTGSKC